MEFMEFLYQCLLVLVDQTLDLAEVMYRNSTIPGEQNLPEPKFALPPRHADMNMWWFTGLIRIEVKAIWTNSLYGRHWAWGSCKKPSAATSYRKPSPCE
jgi:hypothetical protein